MEKRLVEEIAPENGLTLLFLDGSRRLAGDRWLVSFWAAVDVEVKAAYLDDQALPGVSLDDVRAAVGEKVS